jgi:site-specific recombinase XerD
MATSTNVPQLIEDSKSAADIPTPARKARPARSRRGHMAFLTTEEMLAVLKAARSRSSRDWAMILVAYRHGMRASEVCGLRRDDLHLGGESITIRRLKGSLETCQAICGHAGQPLLDELKALRQWMKDRPGDGSDYVFTSQKGGRIHRSQFFRVFQHCAASAGLARAKRHPHVLKHSLATHLIARNVNLAVVKQALGHKSINSTMVYVTVSDRQAGDLSRAALMSLY